MRARLTLLAGGAAVAAAAAYKLLRSRTHVAPAPVPVADPRAEELREKLAASREIVDERDRAEERETPVDEASDLPGAVDEAEVEERRRSVHERGRAAVSEMQSEAAEPTQTPGTR